MKGFHRKTRRFGGRKKTGAGQTTSAGATPGVAAGNAAGFGKWLLNGGLMKIIIMSIGVLGLWMAINLLSCTAGLSKWAWDEGIDQTAVSINQSLESVTRSPSRPPTNPPVVEQVTGPVVSTLEIKNWIRQHKHLRDTRWRRHGTESFVETSGKPGYERTPVLQTAFLKGWKVRVNSPIQNAGKLSGLLSNVVTLKASTGAQLMNFSGRSHNEPGLLVNNRGLLWVHTNTGARNRETGDQFQIQVAMEAAIDDQHASELLDRRLAYWQIFEPAQLAQKGLQQELELGESNWGAVPFQMSIRSGEVVPMGFDLKIEISNDSRSSEMLVDPRPSSQSLRDFPVRVDFLKIVTDLKTGKPIVAKPEKILFSREITSPEETISAEEIRAEWNQFDEWPGGVVKITALGLADYGQADGQVAFKPMRVDVTALIRGTK